MSELKPLRQLYVFDIALGILLGVSFNFPSTVMCSVGGIAFCLLLQAHFQRRTPLEALLGLCFLGLVFQCFAFSWVLEPIQRYTGLAFGRSALIFGIFQFYSWLQFFITGILLWLLQLGFLKRSPWALACAWASSEVLFPQIFPWTLGYSQLAFVPFAQLSDLFGASFLSFILMGWAGLVVKAFLDNRQSNLKSKSLRHCLILTVIVFVYGTWNLKTKASEIIHAQSMSVALIQGGNQTDDFSSEKLPVTFEKYQRLSERAGKEKAGQDSTVDLIVWPESTYLYNVYSNNSKFLVNSKQDPLPDSAVPVLAGGVIKEPSQASATFYNSAHLFLNSGNIVSYKKQVLFPFVESSPIGDMYLPFQGGLSRDTYLPGDARNAEMMIIPVKRMGADEKHLSIASLGIGVCYEDLFPDVFLRAIKFRKANVLINLSNDVWFGDSLGVQQHRMAAAWRAIENDRFLLRVSTTGVTEIVDNRGQVQNELPLLSESTLVSSRVRLLRGLTLFTMLGTWPMTLLSVLTVCYAFGRIRIR